MPLVLAAQAWFVTLLLLTPIKLFAASDSLPCSSDDLMNLTDRGGITHSAYTAPDKTMVFQAGYGLQYFKSGPAIQDYIQPLLFIGLPQLTELTINIPDYYQINGAQQFGFGATGVGLRHQFACGKNWVTTVDLSIILPSGSSTFGEKLGAILSGIFKYSLTDKVDLSGMISGLSQKIPSTLDWQRFYSLDYSLELSYQFNPKIEVFAEIFGQGKTGPALGSNFDMDWGLLYLIKENLLFDLSFGHQFTDIDESFNYFIIAGLSLKF